MGFQEDRLCESCQVSTTSGAIAFFWNMNPGFRFHGQIAINLDKIYPELVPGLDSSPAVSEETFQIPIDGIHKTGWFGAVTAGRFPWSKAYRTREYLV